MAQPKVDTRRLFSNTTGRKKQVGDAEVISKEDALSYSEPTLYELTDLFHAYYDYHNTNCMIAPAELLGTDLQKLGKPLSRFAALRKIEAARLGSRPYQPEHKVVKSRPNISYGYLSLLLKYLRLPYKSVFTDGKWVRIQVNKKLFNKLKLSEDAQMQRKMEAQSLPNVESNKEIGEDMTNAFVSVLRISKKVNECIDSFCARVVQDGLAAAVHSDVDWQPEPVNALDLVTEPQAGWCPSSWTTMFVIKKMTAQEVVQHIRQETPFWNTEALRWALENSTNNRGSLYRDHHNFRNTDDYNFTLENFSVQSFLQDKLRKNNLSGYYGNLWVVEAYYVNEDGKVNKAIFFPSTDFKSVPLDQRRAKYNPTAVHRSDKRDRDEIKELEQGDILFFRKSVFDNMSEAITVIPFDRTEPSLERQRGYGHELYAPIEQVMRLDCSILNVANLMGIPFYKNANQGNSAQQISDLEMSMNGDFIDIGERDFVSWSARVDLNGMLGVRRVYLDWIMSKAFLGGLDGGETQQNSAGPKLANLRLVRDGRIHKHDVEDFSKGLKDFYSKIFIRILKLNKASLTDVVLDKLFFETLKELHEHDDAFLEYNKDELIPDTGLPYWLELEAVRNGASHFGAAEMVLYSEIKNVFGDGLTQANLDALNRQGIRSLLGAQDALDILGDPTEQRMTSAKQVRWAKLENASLLGAIDNGILSFEDIPVVDSDDDAIAHLSQVHNVKAKEIIERLSQGDVTPAVLAQMDERDIDSRIQLILKLGALANHISLHQNQLERFGSKRRDVNQLKEETNAIMQSAEALMNSVEINLRVLQEKREEQLLKLQNLSTENIAEQEKANNEKMRIQLELRKLEGQQQIALRLADDKAKQHLDKQLTAARDREVKERRDKAEIEMRREEIRFNNTVKQKQQPSE